MKTIKPYLLIGLTLAFSSVLARSFAQTTEKANATAPVNNDFSIVAGQSIGKIQLGDSREKVHQVLGAPNIMALNGGYGGGWERYNDLGLEISYREFKVAFISAISSKYKTAEGISVGSNPDVIRKIFKGGILTKVSQGVYAYTDAKRGIKFQFGNDKNHSTKWCDAIIITAMTK